MPVKGAPAVLGPAGGRGGAPGPPLPRPVLPRERYFILCQEVQVSLSL